jgi:hypothetical protein
MKKIILLLSVLLLQQSCSSSDSIKKTNNHPDCISSKIQIILGSPIQNPKANIQKYNYNNAFVYAVNYIKNDGTNLEVYNDECVLICSTGSTIDGTPFSSCVDWNKATLIETVWTDPR